MAATISLRLTNRSPKQPIKRLPESIQVPNDATIEDLKHVIAKQAGIRDHNRIGIFDVATKKTIKDRRALVKDQVATLAAGEILVKDLGPQVSWRTVYMVEYVGPILVHLLFVVIRPYVYFFWPYIYKNETETPMTKVQWLLFALFLIHFTKRELETMFLHKFSANTMPARKVFINASFYWGLAGLLSAWDIYAPQSFAARQELGLLDYVGIAMFVYGNWCNFLVHVHLAGLRSPGGTERKIPNCIGSDLVTSPNYMFELLAWAGVILICRSWAVCLFIYVGGSYMRSWSRDKEKLLRDQFGDKYKKKRYTMLPGLI